MPLYALFRANWAFLGLPRPFNKNSNRVPIKKTQNSEISLFFKKKKIENRDHGGGRRGGIEVLDSQIMP